jgi:BolA protein
MNNETIVHIRIEEQIEQALSKLEPSILNLENHSSQHAGHGASGAHFKLSIASPKFAGQSKITCHRLIYEALGELMQGPIHALQIEIL